MEGDHTQRTVWLRQLPLPIRLRVRTTVPHSLALFLRLLWTSSTLPWAPCWGNRVIQGSLGSQGRSHQPYPPPHTLVLTFVWTVDGRRAALLLATSICGEAICLPAAGPSEAGRRETTHGYSHAQQQKLAGNTLPIDPQVSQKWRKQASSDYPSVMHGTYGTGHLLTREHSCPACQALNGECANESVTK